MLMLCGIIAYNNVMKRRGLLTLAIVDVKLIIGPSVSSERVDTLHEIKI